MWDWLGKLGELVHQNEPLVLATLTKAEGSTPRAVGAKMLILANGEFYGSIGGGNLEKLVLEKAKECLASGTSTTQSFDLCERSKQCCGGRVEVFFEVMNLKPVLYIFGAGHVGQAVCQVLQETPFEIHAIDARKEWIDAEEIPQTVIRHRSSWKDFIPSAKWNDQFIYAVIMTHHHEQDQEILQMIIEKPTKYLGMIGSHHKWKRFRERLLKLNFNETVLDQVKCPIGLDIGGKAPKEIAVSLAGEILKIHYGK